MGNACGRDDVGIVPYGTVRKLRRGLRRLEARRTFQAVQHGGAGLHARRILRGPGKFAVFLGGHGAVKILLRGGGMAGIQLQLHAPGVAVERALHAVAHAVEDLALVEELHLRLCRVDIHVHQMLRNVQMQHAGREAPDHHAVAIRLLQRRHERLGAHETAVYEEKLAAAIAARGGRLGDKARQGGLFPMAVHRDHILGCLPAEDGIHRAEELAVARGVQQLLALAQHAEGNLRMRHGQPPHRVEQRRAFDGVAFHEFHTRGRVEKQVAHDDGRPVGAAGLLALRDLARLQMQAQAEGRVCGLGQQVDARDGRDRRQRFAAETERVDGLEVGGLPQLARRMAQKGRLGFVGRNAAAVVRDAQEGHAAVLQLDGDVPRAGVNGILDQLLGGAGRALDHLARGDEVGNMRRKLLNLGHKFLLIRTGRPPVRRRNRAA